MADEFDCIVVGGGLAGSAVAARLARAGRSVALIERDQEPADKVCGEFLTGEAAEALGQLRVDVATLGAQPIGHVRLNAGRRSAETSLEFPSFGVSRRVLDPVLRDEAVRAGAVLFPGTRAVGVWAGDVHIADGRALRAPAVVLATGKHEMRAAPRRRVLRATDCKIGFKEYLSPDKGQRDALAGRVELFLFRGGYAGLLPVEGGRWNFSLTIEPGRLKHLGGRYEDLMSWMKTSCPALAERLDGTTRIGPRPLAIGAVPYGYRLWKAPPEDGIWRVGDQAVVTPSLTGAGMALALDGARLLSEALITGQTMAAYQMRLRERLGRQLAFARFAEQVTATGWSQSLLVSAARRFPYALRLAANLTRLDRLPKAM